MQRTGANGPDHAAGTPEDTWSPVDLQFSFGLRTPILTRQDGAIEFIVTDGMFVAAGGLLAKVDCRRQMAASELARRKVERSFQYYDYVELQQQEHRGKALELAMVDIELSNLEFDRTVEEIEDCAVRAPVSGVVVYVGQYGAGPGTFVARGTHIFDLVSLDEVRVEGEILGWGCPSSLPILEFRTIMGERLGVELTEINVADGAVQLAGVLDVPDTTDIYTVRQGVFFLKTGCALENGSN